MSKKKKLRLFLSIIFLFGQNITLAEKNTAPGLVGGLQFLIKETREQISEKYKALKNANQIEYNPSSDLIQKSTIDPLFINSLMLHSDERYLHLMSLNQCHFYSLLDAGALKFSLGGINLVPLIHNKRPFLIPTKRFVELTYTYKCKGNSSLAMLFSKENLVKTIQSLKINIPKNEKECTGILSTWKKNSSLPYMCMIPQKITDGDRARKLLKKNNQFSIKRATTLNKAKNDGAYYKKNISYLKRSYFTNLCSGLINKDKFCSPYLAKDGWSKIINGELSKDYLHFHCAALLRKEQDSSLTKLEYQRCAQKLQTSPFVCTNLTPSGYSALYPTPNCSRISIALNNGRLATPYRDCPGQIDNTSITNLHRILTHFKVNRGLSTTEKTCFSQANMSLADIFLTNNNKNKWPLHICYYDKIESSKVCKFYIPGHLKNNVHSEEKVITKILYRLGKLDSGQSCNIVSRKKYNPVYMEYKSGCHIVLSAGPCTDAYCQRKIIINDKENHDLEYSGRATFDYFPNQWKSQKYSLSSLIDEIYKIKKNRVENLTQLKIFLNKNPQGIIHGVGCQEDILPTYFRRQSLNECRPLTFIIDGIYQKNNNMMLTVRTSLDDLHSPRLIHWNWIFTAVMNYRNLHPLNSWNLYGIKK